MTRGDLPQHEASQPGGTRRVVLVTGAAGGIGAAACARLAAEGWCVVAADREPPRLPAAAAALGFDVLDDPAREAALDRVVSEFGGLDALVHAAGIGAECGFLETSRDAFERLVAVNLTGTFLTVQAAARRMLVRGGGAIVTLASTAGQLGSMRRAAYAASKAGVINLTQTVAAELARSGIRANVVAPGPVLTDLAARMHSPKTRALFAARVPLRRYGAPEEIAACIAFLVGPGSGYVTGHVFTVDGGFTAVPAILEE